MKSTTLLSLLQDRCIHSGESLARTLGVSRTAVWKQIRRAQADGVEIKTIRGQGYQLVSVLDLLLVERILAALTPRHQSKIDLVILDDVDSTNAEVARRLKSVPSTLPVVIADSQSAGRGRRGRNWASPRGENLYLSLGLTVHGGFSALDGMSLVLGVAVSRALAALGTTGVGLKWPNDLFSDNRKLGGILVEIQGELQDGEVQVIAGIGINVHMSQVNGVDQPWASLANQWPEIQWSRNEIAAAIVGQVLAIVAEFEEQGFAAFREEWQAQDIFFGQDLMAREGDLLGQGRGIDATGNYQVMTAQGLVAVRAGDISLRVRS
ncbi:biotin--[acetyl-CoA-carboxylase] ligase [Marinobacter halophilus]|uniref:Bifunctional ligase/repressor BirA n=1 Tax=Marinobacter halophilus TaxID=1323740 RepID=A0A2T1KHM9_9GAMM|nr:biotin--[acetyl-CoA-carboxylase] ligase [Marinobacter halophilus]PSF09223.1 biotin--[acetyl-CoA-carboxylase] ligase [Marinobacter halophilus]GGC84057.1 bifunctional ligase/repressor BirA [Marinobacter halophilus]